MMTLISPTKKLKKVKFSRDHVPNILTLSRVPLTIATVFLTIYGKLSSSEIPLFSGFKTNYPLIAAFIFGIFCVVTDFLDGFLARKWKIISTFGEVFDPVLDKTFIITLLILLSAFGSAPWYLAVPLIVRDLLMDIIRLTRFRCGLVIPALPMAKLKTTFQFIGILVLIIFTKGSVNGGGTMAEVLRRLPLSIALFFSISSFIQYMNYMFSKK